MKKQIQENTTRLCVALFIIVSVIGTSSYIRSGGRHGGGGGHGSSARAGGGVRSGGGYGMRSARSGTMYRSQPRNITAGSGVARRSQLQRSRTSTPVANRGPQRASLRPSNRNAGLAKTGRTSRRADPAIRNAFSQHRHGGTWNQQHFNQSGWGRRFGWRWSWFAAGWPWIWVVGVPFSYALPGDFAPSRYCHFTNQSSQDVTVYMGNQQIPLEPGQEVWALRSLGDWFSVYSDSTGESAEFRTGGASYLTIYEDADSGLLTVQPTLGR